MLERETELIKQIIIESTINGRLAIKLNDVMGASVPRGVKAFMTAEVMRMIDEDFSQSHALSHISKGISSTVTAERSLLRSVAMEYVLQQKEYFKLVEDTVHFLENYLCRPQWTLYQLMFEKASTISFDALVKKFDYVVDYTYFGTLVARYAQRKGAAEITSDEFRVLISRIDEQVIKQHSPRELALLTKPIFDFLLFGESSMTRPIPLAAILLFYDDKNLTGVKDYIDRICHVRSRTQISMTELIGILEDLYHVETTVKEEVRESERAILKPIEQTAQITNEQATTSEVQEEPPQPAADQLTEEPTLEVPMTPADTPDLVTESSVTLPSEPPIEDQPKVEVTKLDTSELEKDVPPVEIPLPPVVNADELVAFAREREAQRYASYLTFPERRSTEHRGELPDINELLTKEQREKFVSEIFDNDENSCFIFLSSFNTAKTWRDAQPYLRDLFEMKRLNILSPEVVEFTDAMQARFHPELRKAE
jgi:hypothetical protein